MLIAGNDLRSGMTDLRVNTLVRHSRDGGNPEKLNTSCFMLKV